MRLTDLDHISTVGYSKEWLPVDTTSLLVPAKLILKSCAPVDADTCPSLKYRSTQNMIVHASQQRSCTNLW